MQRGYVNTPPFCCKSQTLHLPVWCPPPGSPESHSPAPSESLDCNDLTCGSPLCPPLLDLSFQRAATLHVPRNTHYRARVGPRDPCLSLCSLQQDPSKELPVGPPTPSSTFPGCWSRSRHPALCCSLDSHAHPSPSPGLRPGCSFSLEWLFHTRSAPSFHQRLCLKLTCPEGLSLLAA